MGDLGVAPDTPAGAVTGAGNVIGTAGYGSPT
jgi:hypothetical protein